MLRSRPILSASRQRPLQGGLLKTSSRNFFRPSARLSPRGLHQQPILSSRSITNSASPLRTWRTSPLRRIGHERQNSNKPLSPKPQEPASQEALSLSARFRQLSKRYGYAAVGVYAGLSVLDFPFCFLAVRLVGPERVGEVEHAIVDAFWSIVGVVVPSMKPEARVSFDRIEAEARESQPVDATLHHAETASIWTQLLLAYGVHKSLIFFRIPLTAAVTPKVVKTLRSWGWNIGRPAKRAVSR